VLPGDSIMLSSGRPSLKIERTPAPVVDVMLLVENHGHRPGELRHFAGLPPPGRPLCIWHCCWLI